ncbi:MAG: DNA polymerase II large subunit, partial [Candidatus Bathyarchaeota archaeon]|nr:DNA polymerase II large subunit [Candidatus Bathyarchaeota archaeon]
MAYSDSLQDSHRVGFATQGERTSINQANGEYQDYFSDLERSLKETVEISGKARKKGLDPKLFPEIEVASDLAGLVEGFIRLPRLAERIRELTEKMPRENAAFKVAEDIVYGKFGHLSQDEAASQAIRTALAILTEGVTAAVYSEGIADVSTKANLDGSRYLAVYFAGPIRSAGGTETALTPVIADFVRRLLGMDRYKPTEEEIGRFIEELRLYEREVNRFQYHVSDEELRRAFQYLPVEITGTASNRIEVSSFRNLPRIETNCLRGGALRVVNDGIVGRAAKVLAVVEDLGIQGWEWLKEIREIERGKTSGFMENVPVGRPILCFPHARGGFRLRYGRARNTGLSAVGVHPLTMMILQNFLVGGVQLKFETPSKSGVVLPVDTIETPIVRLNDGSVVRVSNENYESIKDNVEKILYLGDLLVSFGDFLYNNKNLLQSGYTEEWWCQEIQLAIQQSFNGDIVRAAEELQIPPLEGYLRDPFTSKPTIVEAIRLSKVLGVPLHPAWTYFWSGITCQEARELRSWLLSSNVRIKAERITGVKGPADKSVKSLLERVCVPHRVSGGEIVLESDDSHVFAFTLGFHNPKKRVLDDKSVLVNLSRLSGISIRDKAPCFVGARVGRPEKAKRREMSPVVQVLFPIGLSG